MPGGGHSIVFSLSLSGNYSYYLWVMLTEYPDTFTNQFGHFLSSLILLLTPLALVV